MTRAREITITDADLSVLGPLAEHRILIAPQVASLLGVSEDTAARRLSRLREAGLAHHERIFDGHPSAAWITSRGLGAIESRLPRPRLDLRGYRHDVGVGWLWLAAGGGAFGELVEVAADRRMRAQDTASLRAGDPVRYGVGLGLLGPRGRPQHHYPDLVVTQRSGHRVAVELELTAKSPGRMTRIMTAYASDSNIDAVIYVVQNRAIAQLVSDAARRAGIADIVHIRRLASDGIAGAGYRSPAAARTAGRHAGLRTGAGRAER